MLKLPILAFEILAETLISPDPLPVSSLCRTSQCIMQWAEPWQDLEPTSLAAPACLVMTPVLWSSKPCRHPSPVLSSPRHLPPTARLGKETSSTVSGAQRMFWIFSLFLMCRLIGCSWTGVILPRVQRDALVGRNSQVWWTMFCSKTCCVGERQ